MNRETILRTFVQLGLSSPTKRGLAAGVGTYAASMLTGMPAQHYDPSTKQLRPLPPISLSSDYLTHPYVMSLLVGALVYKAIRIKTKTELDTNLLTHDPYYHQQAPC